MGFSIIQYYGKQSSRCGYCKGAKCSKSNGMHAYTMSPQDYQALINRGWRRSGQYCYKPDNRNTCCPSYTIKCDALDFKLSKSNKKILKRMTRFLRDGKKEKSEENISINKNADDSNSVITDVKIECDIQDEPKAPDVPLPLVDLGEISTVNAERNAIAKECNQKFMKKLQITSEKSTAELATTSEKGAKKQSFEGSNTKLPCKKAKQMRIERRQAKLNEKGFAGGFSKTKANPAEKTLADFIAEASPNDKHKLKIVLVPSRQLKVDKNVHALYCKYQSIVHNDPPDRLTPTSLERFLYKTPLQYDMSENGPPEGYGSFHQQYWLDEKLIAVAVIDILPYCLSSVYFFYDPDYSFLSLGTYASLREIEFVQQLSKVTPDLKYYYMGFYIHSCPKMRYKGKLVPSYLLCPEAYTWHLLTDEIRAKLDKNKYQRLDPDPYARDNDKFRTSDLNSVLLLSERNICTYGQYIQSLRVAALDHLLDKIKSRIYKEITGEEDERDQVLEFGGLVGKTCAHRIVYIKS